MKLFSLDALISTLIIFLSMLLFPLLFFSDIFDSAKDTLADFNFTDIVFSEIRDNDLYDADTNIVLINTENCSNIELAKLIFMINQFGPKVLGIKQMPEESDNPNYDMALAKVLSVTDNLVMASRLVFDDEQDGYIEERPPEMFFDNARLGYENLLLDKDPEKSAVRRFPPYHISGEDTLLSFAAVVTSMVDSNAYRQLMERDNEFEIINYNGYIDKFYSLEAFDILYEEIDFSIVQNKIVLLGVFRAHNDNLLLKDVYFSPMNETYMGRTYPDMYGTVFQANIISMLLKGNYIDSMPMWLSLILAFLICYLNMLLFIWITRRFKRWYELLSLGVFVIESFLILAMTIYAFYLFDYEIRLTFTIFVVALSVVMFEVYVATIKPIAKETYYKLIN